MIDFIGLDINRHPYETLKIGGALVKMVKKSL
jgi:hypothetical protein